MIKSLQENNLLALTFLTNIQYNCISDAGRVVLWLRAVLSATGRAVHVQSCPIMSSYPAVIPKQSLVVYKMKICATLFLVEYAWKAVLTKIELIKSVWKEILQ